MAIDIDKTTYHETDDGIWKIVSGTDYGEVWDFDVFEEHAIDYIIKEFDPSPEEMEELEPRRETSGEKEILEAELRGREYKFFKDHDSDEFYFMFYKELDDIENPKQYIDRIWENEVETILSETARAKMVVKHELDGSDDTYRNRLSRKI